MAAPFDTENELSPSVFTQLVNSVKDSFDFVLIDSPAGIGSGFETAAAPADRALIVTNAEPTGVRGAVKVRRKLESMGKQIFDLLSTALTESFLHSSVFMKTSTALLTQHRHSLLRLCRLTSVFR